MDYRVLIAICNSLQSEASTARFYARESDLTCGSPGREIRGDERRSQGNAARAARLTFARRATPGAERLAACRLATRLRVLDPVRPLLHPSVLRGGDSWLWT